MDFERKFDDKDIEALKSKELFTRFICPDCVENRTSKQVFPAVRKGRLDFYHAGGKVFTFKRTEGFTTHQKYASVLACPEKQPYVSEDYIRDVSPIKSFIDPVKGAPNDYVYKRIKENCAAYSRDEARCVSYLYSLYSAAKAEPKSLIVVLDIEVSFERPDEELPSTERQRIGQDRIDLLLMDTDSGKLRFIEAKLFTNKEIRSESTPPVLEQLERYRKQMQKNCATILAQYGNHVDALNRIFGRSLPKPTVLDPKPSIFIFGFDDDQKRGRLAKDLEKLRNHDKYAANVYAKGNPKDVKIKELWGIGDSN